LFIFRFLHKKSPAKAGLGQTLMSVRRQRLQGGGRKPNYFLFRASGRRLAAAGHVLEKLAQPPTTGDDFAPNFSGRNASVFYKVLRGSGINLQFFRNR
jgi:hypothetical protein